MSFFHDFNSSNLVATCSALQLFGVWKVNVLGTAVLLQATLEPGCTEFILQLLATFSSFES